MYFKTYAQILSIFKHARWPAVHITITPLPATTRVSLGLGAFGYEKQDDQKEARLVRTPLIT